MQKIGYALVKVSDGAIVERWHNIGQDDNGRPMLRLVIPDGAISVHSPEIGREYNGYKFVERFLDDPGQPSPFHSELPDVEKFDGERLVVSRSYSTTADIVPASVPMVSAKLTLLDAGLLDKVDSIIDGLDRKVAGNRAVQILWEYATDVKRASPELAAIAALVGLEDAQIDDLFRKAAA